MMALPAIDVMDGRVVRLAQGDFARVTDFGDDPAAVARGYADAGATMLHLVSLDGARDGGDQLVDLVRTVGDTAGLQLQAGGGIRDRGMVERVTEAGAARVVIGSMAVKDVQGTGDMLDEYGPGALVFALDVRLRDGVPYPVVHGWRDTAATSLWHLLDQYAPHGLTHLLCTDVDRDGIGEGPNLDLYSEIRRRFPELRLQASGGVATLDDVRALKRLEVDAVIVGRALLAGDFSAAELVEACA
jgi:phosphoribosylformimino-5-aminoimidazole carboxamide ribotide isomerase